MGEGYNSSVSKTRCWICSAPLEEYHTTYLCEEIGCDKTEEHSHVCTSKRCSRWQEHEKQREETLALAKQQDEEMARASKA